MMSSPAWQLAQHSARLCLGDWDAVLHVDRPAEGLCQWCYQRSPLNLASSLLGVAIEPAPPEDVYVRGSDLVATYSATPSRPTRVQIYWRARTNSASVNQHSLTIDLQISVQTHLLDSNPALTATSSFIADEVRCLQKSTAAEFHPGSQASVIGQENIPACVLARSSDGQFSYAEMVHPADHRRDTFNAGPTGEATSRNSQPAKLSHDLFLPPLEKGVILRARIRGAFVARANDEADTFAAYSEFVAAELPLTT